MITTKMLTNDLATMERQGLIRKAGYEYNKAGDPEQRYELTQAGDEKFWLTSALPTIRRNPVKGSSPWK